MATFPAVICQPGGEGEEGGLEEKALWSHLFFLRERQKGKVEVAKIKSLALAGIVK